MKVQEATGPSNRMRKVLSAGSLSDLGRQSKPITPMPSAKPAFNPDVVIHDALRDHTRDKFRAFLNSLKSILLPSDYESKEVMDRLTFSLSMENGFFWDDAYASDALDDMARNETCKQVLTKLQGLVACHPDEAEPKSKEAKRRLTRCRPRKGGSNDHFSYRHSFQSYWQYAIRLAADDDSHGGEVFWKRHP